MFVIDCGVQVPAISQRTGNRNQLIVAAQDVIRDDGLTGLTVASVSKRAGVSSGFIHYYFGGKDGLHLEAMRSLAETLRRKIVSKSSSEDLPLRRVLGFIEVVLGDEVFTPGNCRLWLQFWAQVPFSAPFSRIERVNKQRSRSNLIFSLARLVPAESAKTITEELVIFIDGLWLRRALGDEVVTPEWATNAATQLLMDQIKNASIRQVPER